MRGGFFGAEIANTNDKSPTRPINMRSITTSLDATDRERVTPKDMPTVLIAENTSNASARSDTSGSKMLNNSIPEKADLRGFYAFILGLP